MWRRLKCCEAVFGGSVRRRCETLDLTVYLMRQLCSSGENIPASGAPVESLSKRREENSVAQYVIRILCIMYYQYV